MDVHFRKTVTTRLDAIIFGVLFSWIRFYYLGFMKKVRWSFFIAGILMLHYSHDFLKSDPLGFYAKTWYFTLSGIGAAMLLPLADSIRKCSGSFAKVVRHISIISYSMYLIHLGLIAQVIEVHFLPETATESVLTYVIYWSLTLVASSLLYRYFEKPMTSLRDKF
jgi:peptidoglycan/LPS O-acetylase OafA/YrhL